MGASQSTRKLNIENEARIHVSEAAMKRMVDSEPVAVNNESHTPAVRNKCKEDVKLSNPEDYWRNRVESLRKAHDAVNERMESEYNKAVAETGLMFKRAQSSCLSGKLPPCLEFREMVIKCYNKNSSQPLLCAQYVNDFNECVASKRVEVILAGN